MLVLEEDGTVRDEVCRNRASRDGGEGVVTCMTWTASQLQGGNVLLGVGWKDGSVMLWSEKERMERTDEDQHGAPGPHGERRGFGWALVISTLFICRGAVCCCSARRDARAHEHTVPHPHHLHRGLALTVTTTRVCTHARVRAHTQQRAILLSQ